MIVLKVSIGSLPRMKERPCDVAHLNSAITNSNMLSTLVPERCYKGLRSFVSFRNSYNLQKTFMKYLTFITFVWAHNLYSKHFLLTLPVFRLQCVIRHLGERKIKWQYTFFHGQINVTWNFWNAIVIFCPTNSQC